MATYNVELRERVGSTFGDIIYLKANWNNLDNKPSTYTPTAHAHGNVTNDGKIGSTAGLIIKTGTSGLLEALAAGSSGQFLGHDGTWKDLPAISLAAGYGDSVNPYASKTAKYVLAAPNTADGAPTFRLLVASDIPALAYRASTWVPSWTDVTDKPTTFAPVIGSGAADAVAGNDTRLTNARTPTAHAHDDRYYTESESDARYLGKAGTQQITGGHGSTVLKLYYDDVSAANRATLSLWASEPGITYHGTGIGYNITTRPYSTNNASGVIDTNYDASWIRFLRGEVLVGQRLTNHTLRETTLLDNNGYLYEGSNRVYSAANIPTLNQNTTGSAATLTTARAINGTNFDGSAAITTANWGTARNLTIGPTAKSVNGSGNVSWTLPEIGINVVTTCPTGAATAGRVNIYTGAACATKYANWLYFETT